MLTAGTGRGKSTVLFAPLLAKREVDGEAVGLSVVPTKALGEDQVHLIITCIALYAISDILFQAHSSTSRGFPGIAINEDSLREAASQTPPHHLFEEVLESKWALVVVSPEMLTTPRFNKLLTNSSFQQHLCLVFVDECHLVDEQGNDFRSCYKSIGLLRSRIPTIIPWIAVSATLPPGPHFNAVMKSLGFHAGHYTHCTLPIDNPHICYIPKVFQYPISGTSFLDLAWLIQASATSSHEITKTLVFCETIELGNRVLNFLHSLLPHPLCRDKKLILPYHSLLSKPGRVAVMENFKSGISLSFKVKFDDDDRKPLIRYHTNCSWN